MDKDIQCYGIRFEPGSHNLTDSIISHPTVCYRHPEKSMLELSRLIVQELAFYSSYYALIAGYSANDRA